MDNKISMEEAWWIISDLITGMNIKDPRYDTSLKWLNENYEYRTPRDCDPDRIKDFMKDERYKKIEDKLDDALVKISELEHCELKRRNDERNEEVKRESEGRVVTIGGQDFNEATDLWF